MINNPVIFYLITTILFVFAVLSLIAKNVMYSLIAAIVVFFAGAIIFYILGSEYNAIIQAAVYGLAVPIIIGLSIMFTGDKKEGKKSSTLSIVTGIASGVFLLAFVYLVMISLVMLPDTFNIADVQQISVFDVISGFAEGIFINYVWAFELVSLLLTIVVVGFSLFRKRGA